MAEAVLAPETEVTPPEDVANPTPEVTTEAAPEGVNQEDTSFIDNILSGIDSESVATADDGKGVTTDGSAPAGTENLTPEQAKEQGRREKEQEIASERTSLERQNYINGLNFVVKDVPDKLTALAERYSMSPADVTEMFSQFNRLNGALRPLYDHATEQARPQIYQQAGQEMEREVARLQNLAIKEALGDAALKALSNESIKTWEDWTKGIVAEARKGYVPSSDYTSKKSVKDLLSKYDTALKERGLSLADITGNGGTDLPPPQGGGRSKPDEVLANPNASREERNAAFERKHGFRPE